VAEECDDSVFPLTMNSVDRLLVQLGRPLRPSHFQLVGAVCLFIASKLRDCSESVCLSANKLAAYSDFAFNASQLLVRVNLLLKLKFHGTDTDNDTDIDLLADIRARILARKSACPAHAAVGLPRRAARSARRLVRRLLSDTRFSSRGCPLGMGACTRVRVLYTINYRVHIYKISR